jgi:hypothetical protein
MTHHTILDKKNKGEGICQLSKYFKSYANVLLRVTTLPLQTDTISGKSQFVLLLVMKLGLCLSDVDILFTS